MIRQGIIDTGPLVAFMNEPDQHHEWAQDILQEIEVPLITCEAVISEASFLLANRPAATGKIGSFLRSGAIEIRFSLADDPAGAFALMKRYANVPMSFADACLVCMSEQQEEARVLTLDGDFEIYRRHGRRRIPLLAPWSAD